MTVQIQSFTETRLRRALQRLGQARDDLRVIGAKEREFLGVDELIDTLKEIEADLAQVWRQVIS